MVTKRGDRDHQYPTGFDEARGPRVARGAPRGGRGYYRGDNRGGEYRGSRGGYRGKGSQGEQRQPEQE